MKREEIIAKWDGLSARERDAWVAEAVFGKYAMSYADVDDLWIESGGVGTLDTYVPLPTYTTDISAAWAVVDKSAEWGGMDVSFTCSRNGARRYTVETYAKGRVFIVATGQTAPEAICLTAIIVALAEVVA